jgi:hypothetical protein
MSFGMLSPGAGSVSQLLEVSAQYYSRIEQELQEHGSMGSILGYRADTGMLVVAAGAEHVAQVSALLRKLLLEDTGGGGGGDGQNCAPLDVTSKRGKHRSRLPTLGAQPCANVRSRPP